MADLRRDDAGQVLLIAAFALAVVFVALALVINSAIFTENLASRGEISGSTEALTYQHQVEAGVAGTIAYANVHNHSGTPGLTTTLDTAIEDLAAQAGTQQSLDGHLIDVELVGTTSGTRIVSNASGGSEFRSEGGATAWQLAEGVRQTRNVEIDISDTGELSMGVFSSAFRLELNRTGTSGDLWNASIRRGGSVPPYPVVLEVQTPAGNTAQCSVTVSSDEQLTVDVTDGVVGGEPCPALTELVDGGTQFHWATGITPNSYNITIENGDQIQGNYSMVVRPTGSPVSSNFDSFPNDPYTTDAIYSAGVSYAYRTPNVAYEAEIVVAPGEPDD